jgi:hypothetical protein
MSARDPKQAILDFICQPLGQIQPSSPLPPGVPLTEWVAERRRGGGLGAKASTVQFLQERRLPDRQIHLVAFENETGQQEQWICYVKVATRGDWQFAGGAGGTNGGEEDSMPQRGTPSVNLGAGWRGDLFWAGGRVRTKGLDVVRVRLISANNIILEDLVQDGLVLFVSDQAVQRPLQAELFDRSGKVVGTHQVLSWEPPEPTTCRLPS